MSTETNQPEPVAETHEAQTPAKPPKPAKTSKKKPAKKSRMKTGITVVVLACAALWLAHFVNHMLHYEETDDAYVAGHLHQVSSRVEGTVSEVLVDDNQLVKEGEPMVRLDPLELEIGLQKAKANLNHARASEAQARAAASQAKAQAGQAQAEVSQAEAKVLQAAAQFQVADQNKERNTRLYTSDNRAISKADMDNTGGQYDAAQAELKGAKAGREAAGSSLAAAAAAEESAAAQLAAAQATVAAGEAAVRDAERLLSYTNITAPVTGRIGAKNVESGNRLQPGQAVLSVAEEATWVVANFKETQLGRMRAGQKAELEIDALPGRRFTGKVESLSPASGAQYALLPPDNATGNFTKVVQRVPVKIVFDPESIKGFQERIRPGLSVVVNVKIR